VPSRQEPALCEYLDVVQDAPGQSAHSYPTEKNVDTLMPIIEAFTKAGDVVLDPFAGSGSSLVAAARLRRNYIAIELEQKYCEVARRHLAGVTRFLAIPRREPRREEAAPFRGALNSGQKSPGLVA
jgi:DNA modification methylase